MFLLVLKACLELIRFDPLRLRGRFRTLEAKVRQCPVTSSGNSLRRVDRICLAVDIACICYPKKVQCLQRSAAVTCLLRRQGINAQMVIGAQPLPFRSHAWVEVGGQVVNDKPYTAGLYEVLDRC